MVATIVATFVCWILHTYAEEGNISMTYNWPYNRPDLDRFVVGDLYKHSETDELVEFIGVASGGGFAGEDLAIFRTVPDGGCLIASKETYERGETFRHVGDAMADELE
jgi:hypothetical protein